MIVKKKFFLKFKYTALHLLTPFELKEVRDILKDRGFQIPENLSYQFWKKFSYTFTFTKKTFY